MHGDFDFDEYLHTTVGPLTAYCAAIVGGADAEDFSVFKNLDRFRPPCYNKTKNIGGISQ